MAERSLSRSLRLAVAAAISATLLLAAGITVWRVLRPTEVVNPAAVSYPSALDPVPGKVGALVTTPLIVDDRIRVFAKKREVWADGPPDYQYERSAYWSYRRWPAEVVGVTVLQGDEPLVVTAWSDGMLVGIDAVTGTVAWRVESDALGSEYSGRRTGANTVYLPPGLFTSDSTIITVSSKTIRGYRADGIQVWERPLIIDTKCHGDEFTGREQLLVVDTCTHQLHRIRVTDGSDLPTINISAAAVEPISCELGHSQCLGMRAAGRAWILNGTNYGESAPLAVAGSLLANGVVVTPDRPSEASEVSGVDPNTGATLWQWHAPAPATLLAAGTDRVFLLTTDRTLATLDPHTGADLTRSGINVLHEPTTPYAVHLAYTSHRYVVLERVNPGVPESADDNSYYFTNRPALIAIG
jgi:outer membrane protein assembly factor BamB